MAEPQATASEHRHPTFGWLTAREDGTVFSDNVSRVVGSKCAATGRWVVSVPNAKGKRPVNRARIIYEAWYGILLPKGHEVDHVNDVKDDDRPCNLQLLLKADNVRKHAQKCKERIVRGGNAARASPVEAINPEGTCVTFATIIEAASCIGVSSSTLFNALSKLRPAARHTFAGGAGKGWCVWRRVFADLPGEEWRKLNVTRLDGKIQSIRVSNHGRVQWLNRAPTFGSNKNGYREVGVRNIAHLVHRLVARAFLGDPPAEDAVVNHIDSDRANNRVANLEWATQAENVAHSLGKRMRVTSPDGEVRYYDSGRAASEALGRQADFATMHVRTHGSKRTRDGELIEIV